MLIAQVSDIHLGFDPNDPNEMNAQRLKRVLGELADMHPRPDLVLATGDLTEEGTISSYRALKSIFDACPFPVLPLLGNHDLRANFREVFADTAVDDDGFVQYALDAGPLRVVVVDTLEEGRHGGSFCEARAAWLDRTLAEAPDRPTLLVLHHPPFDNGIEWMTVNGDEPWIERLEAVVRRHPQIVRMLAGHIHRSILTSWAGAVVSVCPPVAPQVALDLAPINPAVPDGRPLIVEEPAGYALHLWTGRALVTHFAVAGERNVLARYDARLQPMIEHFLEERLGTAQATPVPAGAAS